MREQRNAYNNWKCPHCERVFRTRKLMRLHITSAHKNSNKSKFAGDHSIPEKKCLFCNRTFTNSSAYTMHIRWCKSNPERQESYNKRDSKNVSVETRKKISDSMKKYYCGSSIWRTQIEKRKSYAEQYFDDCFPEAEKNYHVNRFFLDLAWPDRKVYLEIDGEQHYTEEGLKRDKERDTILENEGWTLISRVRWSEFQKLSQEEKNDFIYQVGALVVAHKPHKLDIGSGSIPSPDRLSEVQKKKKERWDIIQQSNIDFSKFGWVKEVSKLFGISENKAGVYIARNFPEFYKNCYKRN